MSNLTPEQIRELSDKWLKGTLTERELPLFEQWYNQQPPGSLSWTRDPGEEVLKERLFEGITGAIGKGVQERDMSGGGTHQRRAGVVISVEKGVGGVIGWSRWVAAAIVVVLLSALGYWGGRHFAGPAIVQVPLSLPGKDLAPGGNRATLTLGDGSVISLDSATGKGLLAQQGNVRISKLASGQLVYNPGSGARGAAAGIGARGQDAGAAVFYNTISTARGGQYQLLLPDGTSVWLNAASSLRYPTVFTGNARTVELKGEAYFEVAKNAAMPFHVKISSPAPAGEVEVLGTRFDVNAYDDEPLVKTTLLEGMVRVRNNESAVLLQPGQQALGSASAVIRVKEGVNTEEVIAWKNNQFYFKSADIRMVMRQLSRWYDVDVEYTGRAGAGGKNITAHFNAEIPRNTYASDILTGLEMTGKVKFQVENKKIIVDIGR